MNQNTDLFKTVGDAFSLSEMDIYDSYGGNNLISYARNEVYKIITSHLQPKHKMLDIGCGTGSDAVFFAAKGHDVIAIDISEGMLEKINEKISLYSLEHKITAKKLTFTQLEELESQSIDYAYSNFGALNCYSNLHEFRKGLSHVLKPGGFVTLVIMPPICPWELIYLPKQKDVAIRRLRGITGKGVRSKIENIHFDAYYYTPNRVIKFLGSAFKKLSLRSLCLAVPPLYMQKLEFVRSRNKLFKKLRRIEHYLSTMPFFNSMGDFYILTLKYQP